jgi:hypothetical protein
LEAVTARLAARRGRSRRHRDDEAEGAPGERAGLRGLNEGQKIRYDVQEERCKLAATNLKA